MDPVGYAGFQVTEMIEWPESFQQPPPKEIPGSKISAPPPKENPMPNFRAL